MIHLRLSGFASKEKRKNAKKEDQMNSINFFCIEIDIGTKKLGEAHIDNGIRSLFCLSVRHTADYFIVLSLEVICISAIKCSRKH